APQPPRPAPCASQTYREADAKAEDRADAVRVFVRSRQLSHARPPASHAFFRPRAPKEGARPYSDRDARREAPDDNPRPPAPLPAALSWPEGRRALLHTRLSGQKAARSKSGSPAARGIPHYRSSDKAAPPHRASPGRAPRGGASSREDRRKQARRDRPQGARPAQEETAFLNHKEDAGKSASSCYPFRPCARSRSPRLF